MNLKIGEGCFGPNVSVNDESLFRSEYDQRTDEELENLQQILLDEISKIKSNLDMNDWLQISQILVSRSDKFTCIESECYQDNCDQCGNYNWGETYVKIEDSNEDNNN